jgi:hypothetical protein
MSLREQELTSSRPGSATAQRGLDLTAAVSDDEAVEVL